MNTRNTKHAGEQHAQLQLLAASVRPQLPSLESNRFGQKIGQRSLSVFQACVGAETGCLGLPTQPVGFSLADVCLLYSVQGSYRIIRLEVASGTIVEKVFSA